MDRDRRDPSLNPDEYEALFGAPPDTTEPAPATDAARSMPSTPPVATLTPPPIPAAHLAEDPGVDAAPPHPTPTAVSVPHDPMQPAEHDLAIIYDTPAEPDATGHWKWALGGAALGALIAFLLTVLVIRPSRNETPSAPATTTPLAGVEPSRSMEGDLLTDADIALARSNLDDATILPALVANTRYSRGLYRAGGWPDSDGDCQNNRTEVLLAEATGPVEFRADGCAVLTGQWIDPFSGVELTHTNTLAINHLVPLAEAHRAGAWEWSTAKRAEFASDLDNPQTLVVVSTPIDQGKGDRRPDQWRPPLRSAWCGYAVDWIAVKTLWDLAFVASETDALHDMLDTCVS